MFNPSTIPDTIEAAKNAPITHDKLYLSAICDSSIDKSLVIFNMNSMISKYLEEVKKNHIQKVALTQEEAARYRFNPKLLCYDMYNTPELWSSLLLINNIISQADFTLTTLYVFKPSIIEFIEEILVLEENNINENAQYVENIKKNNK